MLSEPFMQRALITAIFVSIVLPLIGAPLVQKRLSMTGDALSHTSLAGVAIGVVAGLNPLWMSICVSIFANLIIEFIRRKFSKYSELAVVIVMSFAVGITAIMSKYSSAATFSSYLFGSVMLTTVDEMISMIIIAVIVIIFFIAFYFQMLYISFNELQASLDNVNVRIINLVFTILCALVVAIASKTVGALMVSSLMVIPYAASLQLSKSYKASIIISVIISLLSAVIGITLSYYLDIASGGAMVLTSVAILVVSLIINRIFKLNK